MNKTVIHGIYDDEEQLLNGVHKIRSQGIKIKEVFTPFPVHGLDKAMGLARTRIAITSFIYGITGTALATLMMWYMMVNDWPTEVGGKPNFSYYLNIPAFIPITFECTVLCAAHGMAITFFLRSWILPGVTAKNPDPRTTDDKFLMLLELNDKDAATAKQTLQETGASEINIKS